MQANCDECAHLYYDEDYEEYKNLDTELIFVCPEGHRVYNSWKRIRSRRECPVCKQNHFKEQELKNSIINLNNIVPKELPSKTIYNAYTFDEIKDTINRNIPDIINTILKYLNAPNI